MEYSCRPECSISREKPPLVTGAGSGIGAAIARLFARRGAAVAVVDRDAAAARRTAAEHHAGGRQPPPATTCDVSQPDSVEALFRAVAASTPASTSSSTMPASPTSARSSRRRPRISTASTASTSFGVYLCARAAVPVMLAPGRRRDPQHGVDRLADRHARPLRLLDDQGRRADDDALDRRRLREARHPLQLHLPGAGPHAVRRRLSRRRTIRDAKPR